MRRTLKQAYLPKTILHHKHLFYIFSSRIENTQHLYQQAQRLSSWIYEPELRRTTRPVPIPQFLMTSRSLRPVGIVEGVELTRYP